MKTAHFFSLLLAFMNPAVIQGQSAAPTSHITPWLVGPTVVTKVDPSVALSGTASGGDSFFDDALNVTNTIGSKVAADVLVELFDFQCVNAKGKEVATSAVQITYEVNDPDDFWFMVQIDQSNIGDDTEGFVFLDNTDGPTGNSTGSVKFCTRVSTCEGSVQIAFRETNYVLRFDLTENNFDISDIDIEENVPDSFITDVETDFSVEVYQCANYEQVSPHTLDQDENLVICLEPSHSGDLASVVHISNFNIKMEAGSVANEDLVEYNPVWFSTGGWESDSLTAVSEEADPNDIIMISTPVVAQFFIQSHTDISISGNCFLEFDSAKDAKAPVFVGYQMQIAVATAIAGEGCLVGLIRRIRAAF